MADVRGHTSSLRRAVAYYALTEGVQLITMAMGSGDLTIGLLRRIIPLLRRINWPNFPSFLPYHRQHGPHREDQRQLSMDYGAIGHVTSLASRLCMEAEGGEILTDLKTLGRIDRVVEAGPIRELCLKGFVRTVKGFNVLKLRDEKKAISEN